jgi:dynein heavy chain 1, cytosolic
VGIWVKEDKGLLHKLESYAETLNGIQKALGEYLEKQRLAFPRFYFVGDEDLLEIIGNAKDPIKVIRHLPKMFAGIESLELASGGQSITGMSSKEGERVTFVESIDVKKFPSIHEWLGQVEYQMRNTLASLLEEAVESQQSWDEADRLATASGAAPAAKDARYFAWIDKYPAQIALLATQVSWSEQVEALLVKCPRDVKPSDHPLQALLKAVIETLTILADRILLPGIQADRRCKYEQLITELVHQRDVTRQLIRDGVVTASDFNWLAHMRFYFARKKKGVLASASAYVCWFDDAFPFLPVKPLTTGVLRLPRSHSSPSLPPARARPPPLSPARCLCSEEKKGEVPLLRRLQARISRASFYYGFEYLGVGERLVQTPLTDRAYLTLAEALHMRLGGNPFGPAGTGKTETVKALGSQLGRFVLVFNCDETFDFQAMGRILVGLCQCGAWGCFDEFNRLEERILSAVSQQLLTIQVGLRERAERIALIGKDVRLNPDVGVFVTMNPGYAGRSNLPDNLKQLFRGIAMIQCVACCSLGCSLHGLLFPQSYG